MVADALNTYGIERRVPFSNLLNLVIRGKIAKVVLHAAAMRMSIVAHHLVQVAGQVIALGVPVAVFVIDQC